MSVSKRAPRVAVTDLASLQREIDQLFGRLGQIDRGEPATAGEWSPSTDVFECRGNIVVMLEVPGLAPENLKIAYKNHRLLVSGERRERRSAGSGTVFLCLERSQGRFLRSIPLDQAVDIPKAEARLAGGVLTIIIPRLKDRRGRETIIPIRWESEEK
jgi:HSP20 family protein